MCSKLKALTAHGFVQTGVACALLITCVAVGADVTTNVSTNVAPDINANTDAAVSTGRLPLMPLPYDVKLGSGQFTSKGTFAVQITGYQEPRLEIAVQRLIASLERETKLKFKAPKVGEAPTLTIQTSHASLPVQQLGEDENYRLVITKTGIALDAATPLGAMHGLQTLRQLVSVDKGGLYFPILTINDQPRFPWRGLMIDSARHFMPLEVLKRNLDGMESVKLNVFHWHLSDNQGFRVESRKFPRLHGQGSDGHFYTQTQIREVIAYAHERGIRVIPEFDMPCHTTSWFVGYPKLATSAGPHKIERKWGVFDPAMDPSLDSTFEFLDVFIGEMSQVFPDAYFHTGGDECNGNDWDRSARVQTFMDENNLATNEALQAYFTKRVQTLVVKHGKIPEGWDEVLQPGIPQDVVIQSWRGTSGLTSAARQGFRGLLSNGYYIDLNQSAAQHYLNDPVGSTSYTPEELKRILGGEATMWSEFVSPENIDSRIWPRTAAIAERFWSKQDVRDLDSMYDRFNLVSRTLEDCGLTYNSHYLLSLRELAGASGAASLKVLGDVMQPPEGYVRTRIGNPTSLKVLNHLVDAIHPESDVARDFKKAVDRIVKHSAPAADLTSVKKSLQIWRDNEAKLRPHLSRSALTRELMAPSQRLREIAETGLEAVSFIERDELAPKDWRAKKLALMPELDSVEASMVNKVVAPIYDLINAVQLQP